MKPKLGNFQFDKLGVRVPTLVISPFVEKGKIISESDNGGAFEHSSISATVKKLFQLKKFLTRRDAWAGTFDIALTLSEPRTDCPLLLPDPN